MASTPEMMKSAILSGIRKTLIELGSATKVELSDKLKISFPTISKFIGQMETEGEVTSVGLDKSSGGRRAKRYTYNSDHMLGLAIFLEKTETNFTICNCSGEIKEQGNVPSVLIEDGLSLLTKCIESIVTNHPKISSIAIGVPGSVDNGQIFFIPGYDQFQHFDLKGYLEEYFSLPVTVENDMNAAVIGIDNRQGNQHNKSLVYLYFGQNGPGAGLLINGDVVRGSTFFAGEVAFVPQYNDLNFQRAFERGIEYKTISINETDQIDAISRLIASFVAIINPHEIIFVRNEIEEGVLDKIAEVSSKYIPSEHLPELTRSDWKQDYLVGLQRLGLDLIMNKVN
ncbi:ROK family protein [Paucisalibacillus globulus]|uniref:ROK family protein n=1 Tax=Paucisalibacillus globulus TaxID=351095 RepID=UPI000BB76C10|nr:ROK family protein [Paucisalibacillus globulus]